MYSKVRVDLPTLKQRCTRAIVKMLLRGLPPRLATKKWTQLLRTLLAFHLRMIMDVLRMVHNVAFSHHNYQASMYDADATQISLHTTQGATFNSFRDGVTDDGAFTLVAILIILIEPMHEWTRWL